MNKKELLLVSLMEECDELSQRISKALRFGINEIQEGQNLTNSERIIYEFNDLLAVIEVLREEEIISSVFIRPELIQKKKNKIKEFFAYSKELGIVSEVFRNPLINSQKPIKTLSERYSNKEVNENFYGKILITESKEQIEKNDFLNEYNHLRKNCPICECELYSTELCGYILDMNERGKYKDLNMTICLACGDKRTFHDRIK